MQANLNAVPSMPNSLMMDRHFQHDRAGFPLLMLHLGFRHCVAMPSLQDNGCSAQKYARLRFLGYLLVWAVADRPYIDKAISASIVEGMTPMLKEMKPSWISSIVITRLDTLL